MKGFRNVLRPGESAGLTSLGGIFGIASANEAAGSASQNSQFFQPWLKNCIVTLLSFAIMLFFALLALNIKPLNPLTDAVRNFSFTDIYYCILHETREAEMSGAVSIVDIHDLEGRGNYAQMLEDIESMHPAAICVDVFFDGYKPEDEIGDKYLTEVVKRYDNIVYAMKLDDVSLGDSIWVATHSSHSFFSDSVSNHEAFCNLERGSLYDAMKREIPIAACVDSSLYHSMIVETANIYAGHDVTKGSNDAVTINYTPMRFATMKPSEVLSHPEWIEGRIVMLGDLHESYDQHWTPTGEKLAGVTIFAYGIQTLIEMKEVVQPHWLLTACFSYLFVLAMLYIINLHTSYTQSSKNLIVRFLLGSAYARSIIIFCFSSLLVFVSFIIFMKWYVDVNYSWALSALAFLSTAGNLYNAIIDYSFERAAKKRAKSSTLVEPLPAPMT